MAGPGRWGRCRRRRRQRRQRRQRRPNGPLIIPALLNLLSSFLCGLSSLLSGADLYGRRRVIVVAVVDVVDVVGVVDVAQLSIVTQLPADG